MAQQTTLVDAVGDGQSATNSAESNEPPVDIKGRRRNAIVDECLRCPICKNRLLTLPNLIGFSSFSSPCEHLVGYRTVFSAYVCTDTEVESTDRMHLDEWIAAGTWEQLWMVHDTRPEDRLADSGWIAIYAKDFASDSRTSEMKSL